MCTYPFTHLTAIKVCKQIIIKTPTIKIFNYQNGSGPFFSPKSIMEKNIFVVLYIADCSRDCDSIAVTMKMMVLRLEIIKLCKQYPFGDKIQPNKFKKKRKNCSFVFVLF